MIAVKIIFVFEFQTAMKRKRMTRLKMMKNPRKAMNSKMKTAKK